MTRLHQEGKINFLGKSQTLPRESNISSDEIIKSLSSEEFPFPEKSFDLSNDKINVISNEHFLQAFNKNQSITIQNPIAIAKRLHEYLLRHHNDAEIKIVITLRNQCSLIHSLFAESYNLYFRNQKSINTLEKYLKEGLATGKNGLFSMYYYADIISVYTELFGKNNITILFFEDLKQDIQKFTRPIACLLETDEDFIVEALTQQKNSKIKTESGYKTPAFTLGLFISSLLDSRMISRFSKKIRNNALIKNAYHMTLKKVADKIKLSEGKNVSHLTEEDKERIIDTFQLSNERLWQDFAIPREKLIKYGYLKNPSQE